VPKITGADAVIGKISGLGGEEKVRLVGRALYAGGDIVRAEASRLITTGAVSGKHHVPSAPGQPPNEDTGNLRSHIEVTQPGPLVVEVSSNAQYAAALEFGTSRTAARPYMRPAAKTSRDEVVSLVRQAVTAATKGA
jgi:HK97 gp10 family phage protein